MPSPVIPKGFIPRVDLRAWQLETGGRVHPRSKAGYWAMIGAAIRTQHTPTDTYPSEDTWAS